MPLQVDTSVLKTPQFILRAVAFVFSIIVFACIAEYADDNFGYWNDWESKIDYTMFVGITSMLLCLGFMISMLLLGMENPIYNMVVVIVDIIWWVFWLACAAALASVVDDLGSASGSGVDKVKASCAFAWLTWFLWTAITAFSVMNLMKNMKEGSLPFGQSASQPANAVTKPVENPPAAMV